MIQIKKYETKTGSIAAFHGVSGRVVSAGTLSVNTLARLCSRNNTITRTDALSVLDALFDECEQALKQGFTVSLGDIGSLQLTISATYAMTLDEWTVNDNIKRVNVRYTPSPTIKQAVKIGADNVRIRIVD